MKFEGTAECVATPDLTVAVNPASTLERPPRVSGEPGTGRSELARQVAAGLALLHERLAVIARGRRT
jgi:MoxR-like ATPase